MSASSFRPPRVEPTPELQWALVRAFADEGASAPGPLDGRRAVSVAVSHDLATRIAARTSFERLRDELGPDDALELAKRQLVVETMGEQIVAAARELAEGAAAAEIPLVFLKFVALRLGGHVGRGLRAAGDLDVLVPQGAASRLRDLLMEAGCREVRLIDVPHHLAMLVRPDGVVIEVHTSLPGVRCGRNEDATMGECEAAGLLVREESLAGACFLPSRKLLVAHCLVHGLLQHGAAPLAYPAMRMLADLVDLGLAGRQGEDLGERAWQHVGDGLAGGDLSAAIELCRALVAGRGRELLATEREGSPALLLRHVLAGPVDEHYRDALRLRAIVGLDGRRRSLGAWVGELHQALFITRGQVEVMHGRQRSEWGFLFWRLARPFQLLVRLPRYAWGALRHRVSRLAAGR